MGKARRDVRKAYFQGADDASVEGAITSNDPSKLGYKSKDGIQYDRKPMAVPVGEDARPYEQKAFEGAADKTKKEMGPSGEEFNTKKHWLRIPEDAKVANAKLVAGLTKKANVKDSFWTIYTVSADGTKQPVLKASFAELWGNKLSKRVANELKLPEFADKEIWSNEEVTKAVSEKTASKNYIDNVFKTIRKDGFSYVGYLMTGLDGFLKRAQANGKIATAQLMEAPESTEAPAMEASPVTDGAPAGDDMAALDTEVENTASEADVTVELLEQKHEELEGAQTNLVEKTAPETTADVFVQLQDAEKMVDDAKEEMALASLKLRDKKASVAQKIKFIKLTAEAQEEAIGALSGSDNVLDKATQAVEQAEAAIAKANEVAGGSSEGEVAGGEILGDSINGEEMISEEPIAEGGEAPIAAETVNIEAALKGSKAKDFISKFLQSRADLRKKASEGAKEYGIVPEGAPKDGNDEINRAHPDGGHTLTNVEVGGKPGDNGARFDTVIEQQAHDEKVADKMPTGEISGKPVAVASKTGKTVVADADSKKYFHELYNPAGKEGSDFANGLNEEFVPGGNKIGKTTEAAIAEGQAKVVRAYELVDEAIDKGFCERTAEAKTKFVKEVLAFNDESFVSFKNLIDAAPRKSDARIAVASANISSKKIPNIGIKDDSAEEGTDLVSRLSSLNWK